MLSNSQSLHPEALLAVAVSQMREENRFQATQLVNDKGSFEVVREFISQSDLNNARVILDSAISLELEVRPITAINYPPQLAKINAPPTVLYIKALSLSPEIPTNSLAVVGTRSASIEVCHTTTELSEEIAESGITIVSGLALGVDGAAHRGALRSQNKPSTIAVLAHGLDRVYPASHSGLAQQILRAGGVLVSEYAPGVPPMRHHFLARNRIIAGLSKGVVVVQAGIRSGSLVTANFAADYGRDVFVVKNDRDPEGSSGGESLIEQGAIGVTTAREILAEYGVLAARDDPGEWIGIKMEDFIGLKSLSESDLLRLELSGEVVRFPGGNLRVLKRKGV
jgi:DNA processing protein